MGKTMQCILLATPITKPFYATHACLNDVDWRPASKQFSTRLSYGYVDGNVWRETGDLHRRTVNTPANEEAAEDPAYDNAMAVINSTDLKLKKLEVVILELIQAAGGPVGSIVEVTL